MIFSVPESCNLVVIIPIERDPHVKSQKLCFSTAKSTKPSVHSWKDTWRINGV